jgi:hypothetical protein
MPRLLAAIAFVMISSVPLAAADRGAVIEKWYAALTGIDRAAFAALIADDAVISLNDLDVEQSKAEFIASLDEWEDAMKGALINHKIEAETAETVSVIVCYKFPENETLGRETFRIVNDKVKESVQTTIGESCAEY